MNLRCKPGDLAVIVNAGPDCRNLIGAIVRVRKAHHLTTPALNHLSDTYRWAWTYHGKRLISAHGKKVRFVNDIALRPLRDDPGQDETLRIAGLPRPVEAPATV